MTKILIDRATAEQTLEALDSENPDIQLKAALALRTVLEQQQAKPVQEPAQWRDMVVVSLVREGVNKHKARELADHFATQPLPVQEPVACRFCFSEKGCWTWQCYHCGEIDDVQKPAPSQQQAGSVQEPVGFVKGTYAGRLIYDTINPAICLPVGMALYTAPLPVQEPPQYSFKAHWTDDKRIGVVACVTRPDGGVHLLQTIIDPPSEQVSLEGSNPYLPALAVTALREALAQPEQEPVGEVVEIGDHGFRCEFSQHLPVGAKLYTAAPLPEQEPWGACVSGRVFVGRLPDHARKISEDEGAPIQWLYTTPPAPQRPWQGLTKQDMPSGEDPMFDHQFFIAGMVYAANVLQAKNT